MKQRNWMQFILDSQSCELCGAGGLEVSKSTIDLHFGEYGKTTPMTISFVPLLKCSSCGHLHITNAVLAILREQFLYGGNHEEFNYRRYQERLEKLSVEEQWVEENYYYSTTAVTDGFEIRPSDSEVKSNVHSEEVIYG